MLNGVKDGFELIFRGYDVRVFPISRVKPRNIQWLIFFSSRMRYTSLWLVLLVGSVSSNGWGQEVSSEANDEAAEDRAVGYRQPPENCKS